MDIYSSLTIENRVHLISGIRQYISNTIIILVNIFNQYQIYFKSKCIRICV